MKTMLRLIICCSLFVGAFAMVAPATTYACSCAEPPGVLDEMDRAEAVFAGKVTKVKEIRDFRGRFTKEVHLDVSDTWKGMSKSKTVLVTGSGGGDCGFPFEEGKEYLVYAKKSSMYDNDALTTIICDRTRQVIQASEDLEILGEGKAPTEIVQSTDGTGPLGLIAGAVAAAAAVGVFIYIVVKRRRS